MHYDPNVILEKFLMDGETDPDEVSDRRMSRRIGVTEGTIRGARTKAENWNEIDRLCVKGVGLLPAEVYGHAWTDGVTWDDRALDRALRKVVL